MPLVHAISDPRDPRLAPYANLKDAELRRREFAGEHGVFIAESELVVRALLASPYDVHSVLATRAMAERLAGAIGERERVRSSVTVIVAPEGVLQSVIGFGFHRGVLAAGVRGEQPPLDMLLGCTSLTILEGIGNHDNVGGIFRNVSALGGERPGVILGPGCCDPLYRKAIRVSAGHVLHVPWRVEEDLPALAGRLRGAGWVVLAMTPAGARSLDELGPVAKPAVLLGAEGPGLTPEAIGAADVSVRIPMRAGVDSLNVGVAGALALARLAGGAGNGANPPPARAS